MTAKENYQDSVLFMKEKYNLNYTISIHKILNCKPIYTFPDKCKKEKVTIYDYETDEQFNKMCDI